MHLLTATYAWNKIPLYVHADIDNFYSSLPYSTQLVGVEMHEKAIGIKDFKYPKRAVYILGCESSGLPSTVLDRCHKLVSLPGNFSLNVANAGCGLHPDL